MEASSANNYPLRISDSSMLDDDSSINDQEDKKDDGDDDGHHCGNCPNTNCGMDEATLGIVIKQSGKHEGSIVIYHIHPQSYAAKYTKLYAGCEMLAVNNKKVMSYYGGVRLVMDMMLKAI